MSSEDTSWDRRLFRTIYTVLLTLLAIVLIYQLRGPLLWLVIAMFLAIATSGPINVLARHMKRSFAIAIVYVLIVLVPVGFGAILLPPLVRDAVDLVQKLPTYVSDLQDELQSNSRFQRIDQNFDVNGKLNDLAGDLSDKIGTAADALGSIGASIIGSIFAGFTIYILSMFMVAGGRDWIEIWIKKRPEQEHDALRRAVGRIGGAVGGYIGGALLQAFVAGLSAFIVLSILGVPSPLVLATVVAALDIIPMIGSTIAGVIVGVVTVFADFPLDTLIWAAFIIAYQQFENYVIQPRIQSRAVELEPFVVLVAVLFGGELMGVVGAILAIPITATIMITMQEFRQYREEVGAMARDTGPSESTPI